MAETVISKWSKDIAEMEGMVPGMQREWNERWRKNVSDLQKAFDNFEGRFKGELRNLEGDTTSLRTAFKEFSKSFKGEVECMRKDVEKLFSHIWGTQADKEAWEKRLRSRRKWGS